MDRQLMNSSLRARRDDVDDAHRHEHRMGKFGVGDGASHPSIAPGKVTQLETSDAMSPANALQFASWMMRGIDRKATTSAEVDRGALASAFAFLDDVQGGEALPRHLEQRLAHELGVDLSRVRVHTDAKAARAAELMNARAVTVGDRVYFAAGAYDPQSAAGVELIAHEAAHVARNQHGGGTGISRPDDAHEQDAERFAREFAHDDPAHDEPGHDESARDVSGGLPASLREQMEAAFGLDLSSIRVHEGPEAAAVGAVAFTQGTDIYFQPGRYEPQTQSGRELLGHELAHVAQQAHGGVTATREIGGTAINDDAHLEHQADVHGTAAARGERVHAGPRVAPAPVAGPVQRKAESEMNDHEKQLWAIQANAMFGLLPAIEALPADVKTDYEAGRSIAGPRMVAAMKAVAAGRGADWVSFAAANHGDMGHLPDDQIRDIMSYLKAPKDARYYKDITPANGTGRYDGTVDPAAQTIALLFRARIVIGEPDRGVNHPVDRSVLEPFKPKFKAEIEKVWSGGRIKPAAAIAGVSSFKTITNVAFDDNEARAHFTFFITPEEFGPSHVNKGTREGTLREKANEEKSETCVDLDKKTGHRKGDQTNTQAGSAHEFGHAVGLEHPRPTEGQDGKCAPGYGKTAEERGSIMGAGHEKRVVKVSSTHVHNDFTPFITIGEKWGEEMLPASLKAHNKWSAGG